MTATVVRVGDLLDGHVQLDVECLDRIYLNGYVPRLQVGGQVASFMSAHLKLPMPSPVIMEKLGTRFRREVKASPRCIGFRWSRSPRPIVSRR